MVSRERRGCTARTEHGTSRQRIAATIVNWAFVRIMLEFCSVNTFLFKFKQVSVRLRNFSITLTNAQFTIVFKPCTYWGDYNSLHKSIREVMPKSKSSGITFGHVINGALHRTASRVLGVEDLQWVLLYAKDIALLADNADKLQHMVTALHLPFQ